MSALFNVVLLGAPSTAVLFTVASRPLEDATVCSTHFPETLLSQVSRKNVPVPRVTKVDYLELDTPSIDVPRVHCDGLLSSGDQERVGGPDGQSQSVWTLSVPAVAFGERK